MLLADVKLLIRLGKWGYEREHLRTLKFNENIDKI